MNTLTVILSGLAVGAAMTVPGLSGGSAAMIIGIYDKLVQAIGRIFSEPKKSIPLLLKFGAGSFVGMLLIARLISFLLTTPAEVPIRFLFLGAVAGGIPMIFRRAKVRRLTPRGIALILAGASVVLILSMLPEGLFSPDRDGFLGVLLQFIGGILLAAALVLPGVSASHFLYMLGIYDQVMDKLGSMELLSLLPMGIGLVLGIFIAAKLLERLIERHQTGTFMVILGFMLASLRELIPTETNTVELVTGAICAVVSFVLVYYIQIEKKQQGSSSRN